MKTTACITLFSAGVLAGLPGIQPGLSQTFNAKKQEISTSGVHKFVPPDFEAGDQRGPCPGLNALANHGYLPHNGVGTIAQFIESTNKVFGMGIDVSTAFAVYGAFSAGDGLSWSIGGPLDSAFPKRLPHLLGKPKGISFSHNEYEGDGSATRDDFYEQGNDFKLNLRYFKELYDILPADSFNALSSHRIKRIENSIQGNPYFFQGPFTGVAIAGGANSFVWRLAANHSKEFPQGYLSKEVFATFWSVFGKGDNMFWKAGWDRIPDNWYRRPFDDEYSLAFAGEDLARYIVQHPNAGKVGGNLGEVNTFTGVDITNLTGGVFNAATLAQGNNAACFAFQAGQLLAPDILGKLFHTIEEGMAAITHAFGSALAPLNCPKLEKLDKQALARFPGSGSKPIPPKKGGK